MNAISPKTMACKLGCVTGLGTSVNYRSLVMPIYLLPDLAMHCRLLLYNRPKHRLLIRYALLYPLYALCEIAIICTDLAELLGSAIGLVLLFPSLPLWAGLLITTADVLVFLAIGDPTRGGGRPARMFEWVVISLVSVHIYLPGWCSAK
jgi:metal iron transporter